MNISKISNFSFSSNKKTKVTYSTWGDNYAYPVVEEDKKVSKKKPVKKQQNNKEPEVQFEIHYSYVGDGIYVPVVVKKTVSENSSLAKEKLQSQE